MFIQGCFESFTVQNLLFKAEGNAYILSYKPLQYNTILIMLFKIYVTKKMEKKNMP